MDEFIKDLPTFLVFIVPGFICVLAYQFFSPIKESFSSDSTMYISVMILSVVIQAVVDLVENLLKIQIELVWILLLAIAVGILGRCIRELKWIDKLLSKAGVTFHDDIWEDVLDKNVGQHALVTLEKTDYYGILRCVYRKKGETMIVLEDDDPGEEKETVYHKKGGKRILVINEREVKYMKVFYGPESKKWDF